MQRVIAVLVCVLLVFGCAGMAFAQDGKFEASLEMNRVSIGNPVYLYLSFYGDQSMDAPKVAAMSGLKIRYVGPSTKVSVVNGKVSQSVTHAYLIMPQRAGTYKLGPFTVYVAGKEYTAGPVTLVATDTPSGYRSGPSSLPGRPVSSSSSGLPSSPRGTSATGESAPYTGDNVRLRMELPKNKVYVNEIVPLTMKLYVKDTGLKEISFPTYPHEGFSAGELNEPKRTRENYRGERYDVLVFKQDLFGVKEGRYEIGPANINCKMMVRQQSSRRSSLFGRSMFDDDFFSSRMGFKSYPIDLESNSIPVTILPFPDKGKPADFRGAVGDFSMSASMNTRKVKVGDPIILTIAIRGVGNFDTVTAPRIDPGDGFKTYEPQVSKKGMEKIYEQIFIPKSADVSNIPEVSFSFFNPRTEKYETLTKGPFPIEVAERPESERGVTMVKAPGDRGVFLPEEQLGQDIVHIKYDLGNVYTKGRLLYNSKAFIALQFIPAIGLFLFYGVYRKKERMLTDRKYARSLRAPRKARKGIEKARLLIGKEDPTPFYDAVFAALQDYLGDRFDLPKGSVTVQEVVGKLGDKKDDTFISVLQEIFNKCEMARYAPSAMDPGEEPDVFENVKKVIDHFERIK